ncbi:MAG: HAD family hydrolase [Wenzhouxiangellaceae bacterium]
MKLQARVLSLDLDNTLWPIAPSIAAAEAELGRWFDQHCPRINQQLGNTGIQQIRDQMSRQHPQLAHDLGALRRLTLNEAMRRCGYTTALAQAAWEIFYAARLRVDLYPDADDLLQRRPAALQLAAVTNGNADLRRMGLGHHFTTIISAHLVEARKPQPEIWRHLLQRTNCAAADIVHVGDHPEEDIEGARQAGIQAVWLNREQQPWPLESPPPPTIQSLTPLIDAFHP